ncbi:MAG TPA: hypothetical protein VHC70_14495 [Phycisphaerales bacterium]|jgi:hypothetical protein|nr:hypothetical protein [Phycisphaerales bacterium]
MAAPKDQRTGPGRWEYSPRSGVRDRLVTYLIGISIGLVIAGTIVYLRQQAAQQEAAQERDAQTAPASQP